MSDVKETKSAKPRRRRRRGGKVPRSMATNEMIYKSSWEYGTISSGTTGSIAVSNINGSIQNSSEYSPISSVFGEIKLLSMTATFTAIQLTPGTTAILQGHMWCGTNMSFNGNFNTNPTSPNGVTNLTQVQKLATFTVKPRVVRMYVPKNLEFTVITIDAPSTPTAWAGSPGCLVCWGDGLTNSTAYFKVDVTAVWHLRARN